MYTLYIIQNTCTYFLIGLLSKGSIRSPTLSQLPAENNKVTDFLINAFKELYVKFYVSHVKKLYNQSCKGNISR